MNAGNYTEKRHINEFGISKNIADTIEALENHLEYNHPETVKDELKEALSDLRLGNKDKAITILQYLLKENEKAISQALQREDENSDYEDFIDSHKSEIAFTNELLNKLS